MTLQGLKRQQQLLDRLENRLVQLIRQVSPQERSRVMEGCEARLEQASLLNGRPSRRNLVTWAEGMISENPQVFEASHLMLESGLNPNSLESPSELISALIPMEGDR